MVDKTIQETLKDEGQLVRNTGTNSIKSVKENVNINTEKLEGILSTISDKMSSQIDLMERMVNLREVEIESAIEQRQDLLRQQNLEDVSTASDASGTTEDGQSKKDEQRKESEFKLPGIGSIFGGIFALGAGIPLLYKFVEGFFDERYKERPEANPFNIIDDVFSGLKSIDFSEFTEDVSGIKESLKKIEVAIFTLAGKLKEFSESPLKSILGVLGIGIGGGVIGRLLFGPRRGGLLNLNRGDPGSGRATRGFKIPSIAKRLFFPLSVVSAILGPSELQDGTLSGQAQRNLAEQGITPPPSALASGNLELYEEMLEEYQNKLNEEILRIDEMNMREAERLAAQNRLYPIDRAPQTPQSSSPEESRDFMTLDQIWSEGNRVEPIQSYDQSSPQSIESYIDENSIGENPIDMSYEDFWSNVDEELEKASELAEQTAKLSSDTAKLLADDQDNGKRLSFNLDQISQPEASALGMGLGNVLRFGDNITGGSTIRQGDVYNNINNYTVDPTIPLHLGKSRAN